MQLSSPAASHSGVNYLLLTPETSSLLRPHDPRLRLWHPEEGAAQLLPHVRQHQRKGRVPRLRPHHPEIPAGDRRRAQHPFPPQHPRPGSPRPRGDLQSGRADAQIPGRLRRRPRHVPADCGQAGGEGGGGAGGRGGDASTRKHRGGFYVQHDVVPARLALAALLRALRLVWRSRAPVRDQRSTTVMETSAVIRDLFLSSVSVHVVFPVIDRHNG